MYIRMHDDREVQREDTWKLSCFRALLGMEPEGVLSIDICMLALMQSLMLTILECMSEAIQVESQYLRW